MKESIVIRYANQQDCEALSNVIATVIQDIPYYNEQAKASEISKFQPGALQEKISLDKLSVIVSTINDDIVAFCLSRFDDYIMWLEWFGVLKNHRGKGITKLLLQELDKSIKVRQCHKIWCDCRTLNTASIYILKSHDYKELVTLKNHWYNQDFILWEKYV